MTHTRQHDRCDVNGIMRLGFTTGAPSSLIASFTGEGDREGGVSDTTVEMAAGGAVLTMAVAAHEQRDEGAHRSDRICSGSRTSSHQAAPVVPESGAACSTGLGRAALTTVSQLLTHFHARVTSCHRPDPEALHCYPIPR